MVLAQRIPAPVQQALEIERFLAGQQGQNDKNGDRGQIRRESDLHAVERELRHRGMEEGERGPEGLGQHTQQPDDGARGHAAPGAGRGGPPPVEPADDDRARAAQIDRSRGEHIHQHIVAQGKVGRPKQGKQGHRNHRNPQQQQVRRRGKRFAVNRHQHILHKDASPRVQLGVVGGDGHHDQGRDEKTEQTDRQQMHKKSRHDHTRLLLGGFRAGNEIGDHGSVRREVRVAHENERPDGREQHDEVENRVAPFPENACHPEFMRRAGGREVSLPALPTQVVIENLEGKNAEEKKVETFQRFLVERIETGAPRRGHHEPFAHRPPIEPQHQHGHHSQQRKEENLALNEIGDHHRDQST